MVYPLFLVLVGGASIVFLLTWVIPRFSVIFADMGQALPFTMQFLLGLSGMLRTYWPVILAGGIGGVYMIRRYIRTPKGRRVIDAHSVRLPFCGDLIKKIEVARFSRTLGTLIRSGVPILQALRLVKDIIGNRLIADSMERVYDMVKEGERLSRPLAETGTFPDLAVQMITIGEETGRLDEMLLRVAEDYEKVVRNMVKRMISFLEPAMILAMAVIVGFIVISVLMAIFSMNEISF